MFPPASLSPLLLICFVAACGTPPAPPTVSEYHLQLEMHGVGDSVDAAQPFLAAAAPHHGIYVSTQAVSGLVEQLDSLGRVVRVLGRQGEGPGEYQRPTIVLADSGRVLINDNFGNWHVFDTLGRPIQTITSTVPGATQGLLLRGDTVLVAQSASEPERFGYPLHLVAPDGRTVLSFETEDRTDNPSHRFARYRALARESDSTFWVARMDRYEIELWSTAGKRLKSLAMQRDWFPPFDVDPQSIDRERPLGMLLKLHRDGHGHLLVLLRRARADWKARPITGRGWMSPTDGMEFIDEVVEVLDQRTGTLLGSFVQRDVPILGFLDDGRVFGVSADASGRQLPFVGRVVH